MTEARDKLGVMAKEINVRLGKASKLDDRAEAVRTDADDHRLAAALQLTEARTIADENHIGWKRWVDENIDRSYRDVKKLVAIGSAAEPAAALADTRRRDRTTRHQARQRKALEGAGDIVGRPIPAPAPGGASREEINALKLRLARLSPDELQTVMSYSIRQLLDHDAQRALAERLTAMVVKRDDDLTIPDFLRKPQPTKEKPNGDS